MRTKIGYLRLAIAGASLFALAWFVHRLAPESAPVARGAAYAEVRACAGCHGDPENPRIDAKSTSCSNVNTMLGHPDYRVDCTNVMAYFETVRLRRTMGERSQLNVGGRLIAGERLARKYHCFQCHGHLGQGGFANAGSFKGYIPGYFGADFRALTRNSDPNSVRRWITYGVDSTLVDKPVTGKIAKFFLDRQAINMPSYKSLPPEEIDTLTHYVIALNQWGPMTANTVRAYGEQSHAAQFSRKNEE